VSDLVPQSELIDKPPSRPKRVIMTDADAAGFFHYDYPWSGPDDGIPTTRVGVIYLCNQVCTFCALAGMRTFLPPEQVKEAFRKGRERGSTRLIISGGEPTLCKQLLEYVEYAKSLGFPSIEMQTNAVLLARPGRAQRLVDAGLTSAQVSIHGPDSELSDRLTAAKGTHAKTMDGITELLKTGILVRLNCIIFKDNVELLPDFVELVESRWGQWKEHIAVQFRSPLNEFTSQAEARQNLTRYTERVGPLLAAIDRCRELGIFVEDIQNPKGMPALCVLGADERYLGEIKELSGQGRIFEWSDDWMMKVDECRRCALEPCCRGIPQGYFELFGGDELTAMEWTDDGKLRHRPPPTPEERQALASKKTSTHMDQSNMSQAQEYFQGCIDSIAEDFDPAPELESVSLTTSWPGSSSQAGKGWRLKFVIEEQPVSVYAIIDEPREYAGKSDNFHWLYYVNTEDDAVSQQAATLCKALLAADGEECPDDVRTGAEGAG